jgi:F420-dependent oxidoreductase-like protein
MRIGLYLAYWPWFSADEQIALAKLGDEEGLDSVWIAEAWGQDAVTMMALIAGATERIAIGSAIMQIPARAPAATAMAAATLDVVSNGRFRLGLGPSGPQVSEGWYGVPFPKPVERTREYVEIVRKALTREPLTFEGEHYQLPIQGGSGLGKPLKLLAKPVSERIPIYLGAIGPRSVEQVGEIADGWLPFLLSPENPSVLMDPLMRGLEKAGRDRAEVDVLCAVPTSVAETREAALDAVRPWVAFYLASMGAKDKNFYVEAAERYGFGEEARACQEAGLAGDQAGAVAAISNELIDTTCIAATPDTLAERLARYEAAGVDGIIAVPSGDREAVVRALGAANRAAAPA